MSRALAFIILAAGESQRMGSPKPLLRLGDQTFIEHILANRFLAEEGIQPLVVLGHEAEAIQRRLPADMARAINTAYSSGRMSSIQCGLRTLSLPVEGAFILPVDCPLVSESVLQKIHEAFTGRQDICIPSCRFRRGHPPLIGAEYFSEILGMGSEASLRTLYQHHDASIRYAEVESEAILHNINTPDDYRLIQEFYSRQQKD